MRRSIFIAGVLTLSLGSSFTPANAVFGLSSCEKVVAQAKSDQLIIQSLVSRQASLMSTQKKQIALQGYKEWLTDPNRVTDDEIRSATLAGYKKILSSLQSLGANQKCLSPSKAADVLSLIESYKKIVKLWSNTKGSPTNAISSGSLLFYLK
jgi:hypothetical protein